MKKLIYVALGGVALRWFQRLLRARRAGVPATRRPPWS